jgi:hypothetical protein
MNRKLFRGLIAWWLGLAAVVSVAPGWGQEKDPSAKEAAAASAEPREVEFYSALQEQMVDVQVVPSSYSSLAMRVRNNTQQPLKVRLPDAFAAVPAARMQARQMMQMQGVPASLSNIVGEGYGGNSQGLGASLAGPWWGEALVQEQPAANAPQAQQPAPAHLLLPPGKMLQAQIPCFCLEFGKPDPESRVPYVICPLDELNNRPAVSEVLRQFVPQGINQYVAQLAIWHLATDVPWQMLSQVQFPRVRGSRGHRVTPQELLSARQLAAAFWSQARGSSLSEQP